MFTLAQVQNDMSERLGRVGSRRTNVSRPGFDQQDEKNLTEQVLS
jgi:hypothetical protein